jgi:parallel beta-helix repeat protein
MSRHPILPLLPLVALLSAPVAHAEVQNCTIITSLPTTISTQGLYCLTEDLSTPIESGNAITVDVNNVTIDCNGFKLGGLAAGDDTRTRGIYAASRLNTVVRNCSIRGFHMGIYFNGGGGHVVEDNRFDNNTYVGVGIFTSDGDIIRRNHVVDTGGNTPILVGTDGQAYGIAGQSSTGLLIEHNTVVNTSATATTGKGAYGISAITSQGVLRDNVVQNVLGDGTDNSYGLMALASRAVIRDNSAINPATTGYAIYGSADSWCADNHLLGFTTGQLGPCQDGGGNTP